MGALAIGTGVGVLGGAVQMISGASQANRARKALDAYTRQNLTNKYEDLQVSTLGAELQKDQLSQSTATGVDVLRSSGDRAIAGGLYKIIGQESLEARRIGAELDQQQKQNDILRAQDEVRLQTMMERREEQDLAGIGQQLNVGQQNVQRGLGTIAQAGMTFANAMGNNPSGEIPNNSHL